MFETSSLRSELRLTGIDMGIRFKCKFCELKYELPEAFAGKIAECVNCNKQIEIPDKSEIPPALSIMKPTVNPKAMPALDIFQPDKLIRKVKNTGRVKKARTPKDEKDIVFRCHSCKQKYRLNKELAGRSAECSNCQTTIIIPTVSDSEFLDPHKSTQAGNNNTREKKTSGIGSQARALIDGDANETIYDIDHNQTVIREPDNNDNN